MLSLHICALICLAHRVVFILPNEQPCIVIISMAVLVLLKESILCPAIAFQACTPKRLHFSYGTQ